MIHVQIKNKKVPIIIYKKSGVINDMYVLVNMYV